ncbi:MAG: formyltransferase [Proteobacteria bacterium]|nr:formyltransferase [Pseudomonadota bacterium]
MKPSALVFAYHNVGVRCLKVLLEHNLDIKLVVTHKDANNENIWFNSVEKTAQEFDLPTLTPEDPNTPELIDLYRNIRPDFIFSFYYRHLLSQAVLDLPISGAYNMHGSLLPKFRGRAPVNWAILHGERETGATLHKMIPQPDAGDIYASYRIPILSEDNAIEVFNKVTLASELALHHILPGLIDGKVIPRPQDISQASYFGRRRPEDGEINWNMTAQTMHNLIRAVAPPYPGAFTVIRKNHFLLEKSHHVNIQGILSRPGFFIENNTLYCQGSDKNVIAIPKLYCNGKLLTPEQFRARFGQVLLPDD